MGNRIESLSKVKSCHKKGPFLGLGHFNGKTKGGHKLFAAALRLKANLLGINERKHIEKVLETIQDNCFEKSEKSTKQSDRSIIRFIGRITALEEKDHISFGPFRGVTIAAKHLCKLACKKFKNRFRKNLEHFIDEAILVSSLKAFER